MDQREPQHPGRSDRRPAFPGDDYALVRYDNAAVTHPGGFTVADAFVGENVTRDGSTTESTPAG